MKNYYEYIFLVKNHALNIVDIQDKLPLMNAFKTIEKKCFLHVFFENKQCVETILKPSIRKHFKYISTKHIFEKKYLLNYLKNYKPIKIDNVSVIPYFCKNFTPQSYSINISLNPGYSFGTGEHQTTNLMIRMMQKYDFAHKKVLDIGCGSGILTILSEKLKAKFSLGIDIDDSILISCYENGYLNRIKKTFFINSDIFVLNHNTKYDIILINMLPVNFMPFFQYLSSILNKNSIIMLAGFLNSEADDVKTFVLKHNYKIIRRFKLKGWSSFILQQS